MKKKTKNGLILSFVILCVIAIPVTISLSSNRSVEYKISDLELNQAYDLLKKTATNQETTYYDFKRENQTINYQLPSVTASAEEKFVVADQYQYAAFNPGGQSLHQLSYTDSLQYQVDIASPGLYELDLDYLILGDNILTNPTIAITINDQLQYSEAGKITMPLLWKGVTEAFPLDSYGDETIPLNERDTTTWQTLQCFDNEFSTATPLLFYLKKGINQITISYISGSAQLLLGKLQCHAPEAYLSYEQYKIQHQSKEKVTSLIGKNAIYYESKNSSYICLGTDKTPSVAPYSSSKNYINILTPDSWNDAGQSVDYLIDVKKDGLYNLAFHYQNNKNEFNSFRTIYIDGKIPFAECINYEFEPTGNSKWKNETLHAGDEKMFFYLTSGTHKITLKAEKEPVYEMTTKLQLLIDHINYFSLEILKITGSDVDPDRTWKLTEYIPETKQYLEAYDTLLKSIVMDGKKYSEKGTSSATISYVRKAITSLKKLMKKPDELPLYLENLYSGSSSINQMLGSSITTFDEQPLGLDYVYCYYDKKLPADNASIFKKFGASVSQVFEAYTSKKYNTNLQDDVVNVWVSRPLTYINVLQQMVDSDYNVHTTGPKVKISMMPDASKLLLANAAGESPDVALGLPSYTPFDFAIREAAYELSSFSDFYEVASAFAPGILTPFVLNDAFYALPESIDFNVTVYREDILSSFNIDLPSSWSDLIGILPKLQRYGMNFYLPICAENSTKWFYQTTPMIYQYGGRIYQENGLGTAIDSEESLKGLTLLTNLFKYYSLDSQVKSFYNSFRYGTHPIGIANFSEYLLLKNAAPEIVGKWKIALPLGVLKEDNSLDRTYISSGTNCMIFASTDKAKASWEFLKWWTSASTQIEYGSRLQSTYGPEYTWLSANLKAIEESSLDYEDKQVILESLQWVIDIPRTPGQYMLERGLSNIWTRVALQNNPIGVSIDNEVITINREIERKMKEFGYLDNKGNIVKPYVVREKDWVEKTLAEKLGGSGV